MTHKDLLIHLETHCWNELRGLAFNASGPSYYAQATAYPAWYWDWLRCAKLPEAQLVVDDLGGDREKL